MSDHGDAFAAWREGDVNTVELVVERTTIEPGASFSSDALHALGNEVVLFVGARLMRRWEDTNEPPTVLRLTLTVDVQ